MQVTNHGKNVSTVFRTETKDRDGSLIFVNEFTNFIRGASGKEMSRAEQSVRQIPDRAPDKVIEEKTTERQAALYRLSGDSNPLHIDPEMSSMVGFDRPILHGLCTFGIAAKHIIKAYGSGKGSCLKSIKVSCRSFVILLHYG